MRKTIKKLLIDLKISGPLSFLFKNKEYDFEVPVSDATKKQAELMKREELISKIKAKRANSARSIRASKKDETGRGMA